MVKLAAALAFLFFAFAIVGYLDRQEAERLSMSGYIKDHAKLETK